MRPLVIALSLLTAIQSMDSSVESAMDRVRSPALDGVMHTASSIGRPVLVMGVLIGIAALDGAGGVAVVRQASLALIGTNLAVEGLKRATTRRRPDGERDPNNSSFPSSHAANAVTLAAVLSRRWRRLAPAFWALAALVAFSRMYLHRHFFSDVLVGVLLGWLFAWLAARVTPLPPRRRF